MTRVKIRLCAEHSCPKLPITANLATADDARLIETGGARTEKQGLKIGSIIISPTTSKVAADIETGPIVCPSGIKRGGPNRPVSGGSRRSKAENSNSGEPVSYAHLTLPTILRVEIS